MRASLPALALSSALAVGCSSSSEPETAGHASTDSTVTSAKVDAADASTGPNANVTACVDGPPGTIPGTSPIRPELTDNAGRKISFECYGACGASCDLMEKTERRIDRCIPSKCQSNAHRLATYRQITGASHSFCTWHDACYLECSKSFENDDQEAYGQCARWCDFGCVSANNFNRSQLAGTYSSNVFDQTLAGGVVFELTGSDGDRRRSIAATKPAGAVPAQTWNTGDCAAWGLTGPLGSNPITDAAASEGTAVFTELESAGEWAEGACPAGSTPI